mgnify:CR=1 FL=1
MELLLFAIGLFFLVTFFMPWINAWRISDLKQQLNEIRRLEGASEDNVLQSVTAAPDIHETAEPDSSVSTREVLKNQPEKVKEPESEPHHIKRKVLAQEALVPRVSSTPKQPQSKNELDARQEPKQTMDLLNRFDPFEFNIAAKLPVWVGAICLIFATFFLVKYSIEQGWVSPMVRVTLGALFGCGLVAAGQWIGPRDYIANAVRIAQGLVGAGLVILYVSLYAAVNLYGFIPSLLGFLGMSAITILAVFLSLRHGQPIAIFGLVGGILTPALIGSDDASAINLFGYLFLLFGGLFSVFMRKGWWVPAILAAIAVSFWSVLWLLFFFDASEAFVLILFSMGIAGIIFCTTGLAIKNKTALKEDKIYLHALNFIGMAGGLLCVLWLSTKLSLTLFDWSMMGMFSIALMIFSRYEPQVYQKPLWLKLIGSLLLIFVWAHDAGFYEALAVLSGFSVIYIAGFFYLIRVANEDPRPYAVMQILSALGILVTAYFTFEADLVHLEPYNIIWGLLSLLGAGLAIHQSREMAIRPRADKRVQEHLVAIYAMAASAFIALGFVFELPGVYLPLAFAAQIAATAYIARTLRLAILGQVIWGLVTVFTLLMIDQIILFTYIITGSVLEQTPLLSFAEQHVLSLPILHMGGSALLLALATYYLHKVKDISSGLIDILSTGAVLMVSGSLYYGFAILADGDAAQFFARNADFIERSIISVFFAAFGMALFYSWTIRGWEFLKIWALILLNVALARILYFDMLVHNPLWNDTEFVGSWPLLNGVTVTFGTGLALSVWAVFRDDLFKPARFYQIAALLMLFALVTMNVSQLFNPGYIGQGATSDLELYSYSVAWLLTGLALLAGGIHFDIKGLRMASFAMISLVVLKVFLIDAADLDGLFRIFSFMGLGVSLIGLSFFYTKFIMKSAKKESAT